MNDIKQRLQDALKTYMKARNKVGVSAVRMMMSAITTKEKEKGSVELTDQDLVGVIASYHKKVQESLDSLREGGRDTADAEAELKVVEGFLPSQLTEEELKDLIESKIAELGGAGAQASFGAVMKSVMQEAKGRADGKLINEMVRQRLGG